MKKLIEFCLNQKLVVRILLSFTRTNPPGNAQQAAFDTGTSGAAPMTATRSGRCGCHSRSG